MSVGTRPGSQRRGSPANPRLSARNVRRAAFREASSKRAAVQRRKRKIFSWVGAVVAVMVMAGLVVTVISLNTSDDKKEKKATESLSKKPVVTPGSGNLTSLSVTTRVKGKGPAVAANQTISVNYVGVSYTTGVEFDSSWKRSEPFDFPIGQGQVIEGWDKGLIGVTVGSRVQLDIPSSMAYGDEAAGGAPTGPLRFVVDVLSAH